MAQAAIATDVADLELQQDIATTLAAVRRAYWELVYASDALATTRQSKALAERQLEESGAARVARLSNGGRGLRARSAGAG
jgi:outer membrane protein TolC